MAVQKHAWKQTQCICCRTKENLKNCSIESRDRKKYNAFSAKAFAHMGNTRVATVKLDILDWEMEYNTSGIRTKRISEEKTYNYIYAGDKLMRMTVGNDTLDFSYDTNGVPLTMTYNGTVYYYITNLQGDVISLELADGGSGAQYAYDAWGNIIAMSGTLAELNPLRYRGYVYDQETGFYYLNNRYYDPEIGRFINEDPYISTGKGVIGCNMFAYCNNNPVNGSDPTGLFWQELKELWSYFSSALQESRGYFATAIGVSQIDSALPGPADVASVFMIGVGVLGCAAIATRTYFTTSNNKLKAQSVAKVESITKKAKKSVIFPADPNMFNPIGL